MNKAILMGRLARDPELRYTPNQVATCSFTVAVDRRFRSQDGTTQADFIPCVAWRQTAEFISKYFTKGSRILVTGSIQVRTWDDKEGQRRYVTEVIVDEAEFCESKRSDGGSFGGAAQGGQGASMNAPSQDGGYYPIDDDDSVPF